MTRSANDDLYNVLEVSSQATQPEILAAFKRKARQLHPDVNKAADAHDQFRRLREAYNILRDEKSRAAYDAGTLDGSAHLRSNARAHSKDRSRNPDRDAKTGKEAKDTKRARTANGAKGARDGSVWGSGAAEREEFTHERSQKGFSGDLGYEDIRVGVEDLKRPFESFEDLLRREQHRRQESPQEIRLQIPLAAAFTGTTMAVTLERPNRRVKEKSKFKIRIPEGAKEGDRVRLHDPDVVIVLALEPDPRFEVDGRDLTTDVEVFPWDAVLGTTLEVPTPIGSIKVRIPEGTSTGQRLRLKGKGIPAKPNSDAEPGDLYVRVRILMPKVISEEEQESWQNLRRLHEKRASRGDR